MDANRRFPQLTLEFDGLNELQEMIKLADKKIDELRDIVNKISITGVTIVTKINQPEAGTNG